MRASSGTQRCIHLPNPINVLLLRLLVRIQGADDATEDTVAALHITQQSVLVVRVVRGRQAEAAQLHVCRFEERQATSGEGKG